MIVKVSAKDQFNQNKERFNPYQNKGGVQVSEKYKGRKSKKGQKLKQELKKYY